MDDFTFTFTARDGGGGITEIDGSFLAVGDGLYTISAIDDAGLGDFGDALAYMITVVVDDGDETGVGVTSMVVIVSSGE